MSVEELQRASSPARAASRAGSAGPVARLDLALNQDLAALRQIRDEAAAFVRRHLRGVRADTVADVRLVLHEMASNAIRHACPPFALMLLLRGDRILLEVSDSSTNFARHRDRYWAGGGGLVLIDAIAERWGQRPRAGGKTVWAEVALR
ncbi:ATP-binding protein [Amycolatopsis benzoatilytica]|uniref:ATP-binding protein n=1 Tax=Amycolatopsis benzoatilytica TaxID=346045 RepID=UPI00037D223E|nr:ATP-binding protein [Amycolatopsis benzoatilytica]